MYIFCENLDAAKVISKGEFEVRDDVVKATWYTGQDATASLEEPVSSSQILVLGLRGKLDEEILEDLFENKGKSGGGPVKSVTLSGDKNSATIEFDDDSGSFFPEISHYFSPLYF